MFRALVIATILLFATPAAAGPRCQPTATELRELLYAGFIPAYTGLTHDGEAQVYLAADGRFRIITVTGKTACEVARGAAWVIYLRNTL